MLIHACYTLGLLEERAAGALPALEALVKRHPMDGSLDNDFEDAIDRITPGAKRPPRP